MDVIERVQMRRNSDEKKAADRFAKARNVEETKRRSSRLTGRVGDGKKRKRTNVSGGASTGSASSGDEPLVTLRRRQPSMVGTAIDLSWKLGGLLYPKQSSRIGSEFQVVDIPVAGSYAEGAHSDLYELVYDPSNGNASIINNALSSDVPVNKKEEAFYQLGLAAMGSSSVDSRDVASLVNQMKVFDGSDWTSYEKEAFHREIFRLRKDLTALAKLIGKDLKTCLTYYLSTFKKSDDYRVLKAICEQERLDDADSNGNGVDVCAVCGDGGRLIICDGCEGEYHVGCLRPRLRIVPEGHWECDECVDRKLLRASEQILTRTSLCEVHLSSGGGLAKELSNGGIVDPGDRDASCEFILRQSSPVRVAVKAFATGIHNIFQEATVARCIKETEIPAQGEGLQPPVEQPPGSV
jgi:PHD-finger